jgi:hypothetical protein
VAVPFLQRRTASLVIGRDTADFHPPGISLYRVEDDSHEADITISDDELVTGIIRGMAVRREMSDLGRERPEWPVGQPSESSTDNSPPPMDTLATRWICLPWFGMRRSGGELASENMLQ